MHLAAKQRGRRTEEEILWKSQSTKILALSWFKYFGLLLLYASILIKQHSSIWEIVHKAEWTRSNSIRFPASLHRFLVSWLANEQNSTLRATGLAMGRHFYTAKIELVLVNTDRILLLSHTFEWYFKFWIKRVGSANKQAKLELKGR